jgi:hypothetical protein
MLENMLNIAKKSLQLGEKSSSSLAMVHLHFSWITEVEP